MLACLAFFLSSLLPFRSTDLFAKMAKAASMTEDRISQEEKDADAGHPPTVASAQSPPNRNGTATAAAVGLAGGRGAVGRSGKGEESGVRIHARDSNEGGVDETASREFARLAESLKSDSSGKARSSSGAGGMDVDSDEQETVTLEGEFKAAEGDGVKVVPREGGGADGDAKGGEQEEDGADDDDDLLAAVKVGKGQGKGRVKGKNRAKGKKEKSVA